MSSRLDDLQAWRIFVTFAKAGSVTACAQAMNLENSAVSRAISSLEKACGQPLIIHGHRPMTLTDTGKIALKKMDVILRYHQNMLDAILSDTAAQQGHIKLSAAPGFASRHLTPFLVEFRNLFPEITIDIVVGQNENDLHKGFCDIAVLTGRPTLPGLVYMSRGRNVYLPVASPEYIEHHGMPLKPKDLQHHHVFLYSGPVREETKVLVRNEKEEHLSLSDTVHSSDILAIREAVINGIGIAVDLPLVQIHKDLQEGRLTPILPGWFKKPEDCFIVTTKSKWHIRRIRIFLEWFARKMQEEFSSYERNVINIIGLPSSTPIDKDKIFRS